MANNPGLVRHYPRRCQRRRSPTATAPCLAGPEYAGLDYVEPNQQGTAFTGLGGDYVEPNQSGDNGCVRHVAPVLL